MARNQKQSVEEFDYELLDCGEERRLERFSTVILDRPAPQALWNKKLSKDVWSSAHAYYRRGNEAEQGWVYTKAIPEDIRLNIDNIVIGLKFSINNQLGVFPEQLTNWRWIASQLQAVDRNIKICNGFAYTGAATLMASAASKFAEVCHVDAAKSSVSRARQNAELSHLSARPIRWIVDDILGFLQRELKRGNRYDAFILDPPAFGRGAGTSWEIKRDLPVLMRYVNELLTTEPLFVVLSCHDPDIPAAELAALLGQLKAFKRAKAETVLLSIPSNNGNALPSSKCSRISLSKTL